MVAHPSEFYEGEGEGEDRRNAVCYKRRTYDTSVSTDECAMDEGSKEKPKRIKMDDNDESNSGGIRRPR